jgi:transcriptional regulator
VYTPASFAERDPRKIHDFMRRHPFATLVTTGPSGLFASHLPLYLDDDRGAHGELWGHMARANPQWREPGAEVMAIFQGPHSYISPAWYESPGTVPTWSYVAIHAYGAFRVIDDCHATLEILRRSVAREEQSRPNPWVFDETDPAIEPMLKAIVAFRIAIARVEGKWKVSQNHPVERQRKVIAALENQGDEKSREVALLMRENLREPPK